MGMKSILHGISGGGPVQPGKSRGSICWLHPRDYDACGQIDLLSGIEPWTRHDWRLLMRDAESRALAYFVGAECVAYIRYSIFDPSMSIDRLVVHPKYRRSRIGSELLAKSISLGTLCGSKSRSLIVIVREDDLASQCFYRHHGFAVTQTIYKFFGDTGRDAYVFEREVGRRREAAECRGR